MNCIYIYDYTVYVLYINHQYAKYQLVGGWTNPFEKYARQIGSFPQVGMKF